MLSSKSVVVYAGLCCYFGSSAFCRFLYINCRIFHIFVQILFVAVLTFCDIWRYFGLAIITFSVKFPSCKNVEKICTAKFPGQIRKHSLELRKGWKRIFLLDGRQSLFFFSSVDRRERPMLKYRVYTNDGSLLSDSVPPSTAAK